MATFESLTGPDFVRMDRRQIKALSFDELQLLVLRSQRLLATALFKPVQCLFEVMPDEFVLSIFLEWLDIEELARLDLALTNHYYRGKYMSLLRDTVHKGVLSMSRGSMIYRDRHEYNSRYGFESGIEEWLESRDIFMRALSFRDSEGDIPNGFLAKTGSQLLKLDLTFCSEVSDEGLVYLVGVCSRLEDLVLDCCEGISDVGVAGIASSCPGLRILNLGSTKVTDIGLTRIGGGQGRLSLESIHLHGLVGISDTGVNNLAAGCTNLREVVLSYCDMITDAVATSLARYCPRLCTLNLSHTNMTDIGLAVLGEGHCRALVNIVLSLNDSISDNGLFALAKGCPLLEDVDLKYCRKVTYVGLTSLASCCPGLCVLDIRGTIPAGMSLSGGRQYMGTTFSETYPMITLHMVSSRVQAP